MTAHPANVDEGCLILVNRYIIPLADEEYTTWAQLQLLGMLLCATHDYDLLVRLVNVGLPLASILSDAIPLRAVTPPNRALLS